MKLTVKQSGVPVGTYLARFTGTKETENDFGEGLAWEFDVQSGAHAGAKAGRITGRTPTTKNACGKMLASISGKSLSAGEEIDLADYIGRNYLIIVAETPSGSTRVESVALPPI
ncbi:MAG: hypothetical protein FJ271_03825 [Planctomycetes bacterium]|nr:hypothetical protein [Planctomycetota bacterium]